MPIEIVMKKTSEIIPYWRNPRRNDKTVEALIPVIEKNGFNVPIVIDKNNVVVKGHARLKAAKRLGMEEVPCIVSTASEEVIKADRIADNKIQELSSWDFSKRELELERIGDSLTFEKLFYPEELEVGEEPLDIPVFEYKPTALDFSDSDSDVQEPSRHDHPHEPEISGFVDMGEEDSGLQEVAVPERKKFRTLCPYCGKVVTIEL